jgi:hypothetical protein
MIFSKFFKANWQSKDSNTRITAINEELQIAHEQDRKILIELCQHDENELVRRAALIKLADFDTWLTNSIDNTQKKVREYAGKQVGKILLGQDTITLSSEKKLALLSSDNKLPALELWLQHESEPVVIIALFNKINKSQLALSTFIQKQNEQVQQHLLSYFTHIEHFEKLAKRACSENIEQAINQKIAQLKLEAEKPKQIKKQVQLVLAKLLALKDVHDYQVGQDKLTVLTTEWQSLYADFKYLTRQDRDIFDKKYTDITANLTKHFAPMVEAFEQQKIIEKLAKDKNIADLKFCQIINELSQQLATAIFENNDIDESAYNLKLEQLLQQINESVLDQKSKNNFIASVKVQQNKLSQLPEIAESVTQATHLISKISQLSLPQKLEELDERKSLFDQWLTQWRNVERKSAGALPESIINAFNEINQQWLQGLKGLIREQNQLLTLCQKKIADVKRLINSGKYNAAFGVYKKTDKLFNQLNSSQQHRVQRDFNTISEKVKELSDWEHYIATPRKQKLLSDIEILVTQPLDNPNEQAEKVKEYRSIWNSLGHADDEIDKDLNFQFNKLCEQAFAPCRLFYAEQEKIRDQHLITRNKVIGYAISFAEQFEAFSLESTTQASDSAAHWKQSDTQLNKLQKQWREAGQIDKEKYQALNSQFNEILQPVKTAISAFHLQNSETKKQLIEKAKAALDNEDVFSAIEMVKKLQVQWRNTGFSGAREENQLWQQFRTINDQLFAKRDLAKEEEKTERLLQYSKFDEQLKSLTDKCSIIKDKSNTVSLLNEVKDFIEVLYSDVPNHKACIAHSEQLKAELKNRLTLIEAENEKQHWISLFEHLEKISQLNTLTELDLSVSMTDISASWQKLLLDCFKSTTQADRSDKTIELEVLAGIESPLEFKTQRMAVQVGLMQSQMLSGGQVNLSENLIDWLKLGQLTENDLPFIRRVKTIFI